MDGEREKIIMARNYWRQLGGRHENCVTMVWTFFCIQTNAKKVERD
jgi:hypothetical protein